VSLIAILDAALDKFKVRRCEWLLEIMQQDHGVLLTTRHEVNLTLREAALIRVRPVGDDKCQQDVRYQYG